MQIRAVIVGVPLRIEIVVTPGQASIQRTAFGSFLAVDLCVVVQVGALENLLATAEDRKAVHHLGILSRGHILVQPNENLLVEPNTLGAGGRPAFCWPESFIRRRRNVLSAE